MDLKLKLFVLVVSVVQRLDASTTPAFTTSTTESAIAVETAIKCYADSCTGQACSNTMFTTEDCADGVCKTEIQNSTVYTFSCSSEVCSKEKSEAAEGIEVLCCEETNCNTYEAAKPSSSMRLRGDVIAICVWLMLFLVQLF